MFLPSQFESKMVIHNSDNNNVEAKEVKKKDKKKKDKKKKKEGSKRKHKEDNHENQELKNKRSDDTQKKKKKQKINNDHDVVDETSSSNSVSITRIQEDEDKLKKKEKKRLKKEKKQKKEKSDVVDKIQKGHSLRPQDISATPNQDDVQVVGGRIVSFSAVVINETENAKVKKKVEDDYDKKNTMPQEEKEVEVEVEQNTKSGCTLLLFYQYIEPMLDESGFQELFNHVQSTLENHEITGRARVANEGLNCTLTGSYDGIRLWCKSLRSFANGKYFSDTEFKLTDNLPMGQSFKKPHAFRVDEIVNYGLAGERAPKVTMTGEHLEPKDYHEKMTEDNTVIIDVRNHYEAAIGKFTPPPNGAQYIDPMMRKSTEFPVWLDKPETKEMLRGKQVLMYCTGGVRCERASALLRTKIETEEDTKALDIKGVYQLQGGIDKYFRDFPEGGWWKGKSVREKSCHYIAFHGITTHLVLFKNSSSLQGKNYVFGESM